MSNGKFVVDISTLNLDDKTLDRIGERISNVVLSHLADDKRSLTSRIITRPPGHTDGLIAEPFLGSFGDLQIENPAGPALAAMYGVVIQEAILSNDLTRMKMVKEQAEKHLDMAVDVKKELGNLRKQIRSLEK